MKTDPQLPLKIDPLRDKPMPSVSEEYNTRSRKIFQNSRDRCHIMVRRIEIVKKYIKAGIIFE